MTYPSPSAAQASVEQPTPPRAVLADVRAAASIVVALAVVGALLGVVWAVWSPPGPRALVIGPGLLQADETEAFVAGDGRYLVLSVLAGLVAGLLAWRRRANRGPLLIAALAVGGLVGSLLMELVGHLSGGGTGDGRTNTIIDQLPLSLHMQGLLFVQAGVGVLVYGLLVAFATRDDLGRDDPVRDELLRARTPYALAPTGAPYPPPPDAAYPGSYPPPPYQPYPAPPSAPQPYAQQPYAQQPYAPEPDGRPRPGPSVRPGDQPQDGGGHGDAPGVLQKRDLPPQ